MSACSGWFKQSLESLPDCGITYKSRRNMGGDTDYCKWGAIGWVSLCLELHRVLDITACSFLAPEPFVATGALSYHQENINILRTQSTAGDAFVHSVLYF